MDTPIHISLGFHPFFSLLQISDPLFPIGSYTQSYGLETYVQKGIVKDSATVRKYLNTFLINNFLYNDLLAVRLAWEYANMGSFDKVSELDTIISSAKAPKELRTASTKLGIRFIKIVERVLKEKAFHLYAEGVRSGINPGNHSVIFGVSARLFGIDQREALCAYVYNTASSIVVNCSKLVPISQKDAQDILFEMQEVFQGLVDKVLSLEEDSLGMCCTGFDIRSMQHERLYTRLYIS